MKKNLSNPWLQAVALMVVYITSFALLGNLLVKVLDTALCLILGVVLMLRQDRPRGRAFPAGVMSVVLISICLVVWLKIRAWLGW